MCESVMCKAVSDIIAADSINGKFEIRMLTILHQFQNYCTSTHRTIDQRAIVARCIAIGNDK